MGSPRFKLSGSIPPQRDKREIFQKYLFLRDQINFVLTSWSIIPPIVPVVAGQKWQTQSSGPESSGVPWFRPEPSTGNGVTAFIPLCFLLVIFSRYGCTASSPLALHTLLLWDVLCNCTSSTLRKKQLSGGIFFVNVNTYEYVCLCSRMLLAK